MLTNALLTKTTSLSGYISYVNSLPLLSEEEETTLLQNFQAGNQNAGKQVAEAHLRIVPKIALEFKNYYNNLWDIISEGNIGLLKALKSFSLSKGVRFVTYATLWVRASMQEFILRASSNLKINIGQMQKKIMFNLGKVKAQIARTSSSATTEEIAKILEVPVSEVSSIMEATSSLNNSIDTPSSPEENAPKSDLISSNEPTPEDALVLQKTQEERVLRITKAMKKLSDREKYIINKRFLTQSPCTLAMLSSELKISVERVRQVEAQAMQKMRKAFA